eukprot:13028527-Alexandrium_andersonii.AAC.1
MAKQYDRPASTTSVTCCWSAARVQDAGTGGLIFDPRAARKVMELAGPARSQETADLAAGPLRVALGRQREVSNKVDRGAAVTMAGAG